MSYYHYFKFKDSSKYKNYTLNDVKDKPTTIFNIDKDEEILTAYTIKWYYKDDDKLQDRMATIHSYIVNYAFSKISEYTNSFIKEIIEDDEHELVRNRPFSEYDMREIVDNFYRNLVGYEGSILNLSCIKAEENVTEYLEHDLPNKIHGIFEELDDAIYDYAFSKFCSEECTRQTEDEKYPEVIE